MSKPYEEVPVEIATPTPESSAHIAKYTHTTHTPGAHTLTRLRVTEQGLLIDFAALHFGCYLKPGMTPEQVIDNLRHVANLMERHLNG